MVSHSLPIVNASYQVQLDALGDPTRRAIVSTLAKRAMPVGELARGFDVSRPAISQHLRVLKEARLVRDRAEGTRRIYELDQKGFEALREYLDQFWDRALASFRARVESTSRREQR